MQTEDAQDIDSRWAEARARLAQELSKHEESLDHLQAMIVNQAEELRNWFREQRKERRQIAVEVERASTPVGKRPRIVYAPLNLFARARTGNLEIYWQLVHKGKTDGALKFVYLRKNQQGYMMRDLLAMAKPFERGLVEQAELRARELRLVWRELAKVRSAFRIARQHAAAAMEQGGALADPVAQTGPIELVPSLVE